MKPLIISKSCDLKQYLVKKISDALRVKYDNIFLEINYSDSDIQKDVKESMKTQYNTMSPKDILQPIENDVINKLKEKYPNIDFKVKKARVVKKKQYLLDKYQESDNEEEKKQNKLLEEMNELKEKKKKELSERKLYNHNSFRIKLKKQSFGKGKKFDFSYREPIDFEKIENNLLNTKPIIQKIKPQIENYINNTIEGRHDLLDILKAKMEHSQSNLNNDEKNLYENELRLEKEKKEEQMNEIQGILKMQMLEKEQMKRLKKIEDKKFLMNQRIEDKKYKEEQLKKQIEKIEKQNQLRQESIEATIQKQSNETALKLENLKFEKMLEKQMKNEDNKQKELEREKKKKYLDEIIKLKNEKEIQKKKERQKEIEEEKRLLREFELNNRKNDDEKELLNQIYYEMQIEQEKQNALIKQMNALKEIKENERFRKELYEQDLKRKIEYEEADKNRKKKINELKKSMEDYLKWKGMEKKIKREEDNKYNNELAQSYNIYLKTEEDKKKKRLEEYEEYRRNLEEQIKDNKRREFERIKFPNMY
jgi:hypothetical protein